MQKETRRRQGTFNRPESQRNVKTALGTNRNSWAILRRAGGRDTEYQTLRLLQVRARGLQEVLTGSLSLDLTASYNQ